MRRNPSVTTAGGSQRQTRESTLKRRARGVLRVDIVSQEDGSALMVYQMRNGDTIERVAPNVAIAADQAWISNEQFVTRLRGRAVPMTFDGVEVDPMRLLASVRKAYRLSVQFFDSVTSTAHCAWEELGEQFAVAIGAAWDRVLRDDYDERQMIRGVVSVQDAKLMAALAGVFGTSVESLGSPYDESDADTLYLRASSDNAKTVMVDRATGYRYLSVNQRIAEYQMPEDDDDEA